MFWHKSGRLTTRASCAQIESERKRREDLKKRIAQLFATNIQSQFTVRHLESKLGRVSITALSLALAELQAEGVIEKIVRVESPESHGGIGDYSSLEEVPGSLEDWRTGRTVEVTPENMTLLFKAHSKRGLAKVNG
jgi:hypothetical protein